MDPVSLVTKKFVYDGGNYVGTVEFWDFRHAFEDIPYTVSLVASTSTATRKIKDPVKLYEKLIELGHESPFEFISYYDEARGRRVTYREDQKFFERLHFIPDFYDSKIFTFRLRVPIFVARQIMRHRAFSYMELSRRYVTDKRAPLKFYIPSVSGFKKILYKGFYSMAARLYRYLIKHKVPAEEARLILPVSLFTEFWMQGDYKAWANFLLYRLHPSAQKETNLTADIIWHILKEYGFDNLIIKYLTEFASRDSLFQDARKRYLANI